MFRWFNPVLKNVQFFTSKKSLIVSLIDPEPLQKILDKLDLSTKYPKSSNLEIVDIFPGFALFSSMLNYQLKPKTHVLMEDHRLAIKHYNEMFQVLEQETGNRSNFVVYPKNGYKWDSFTSLVQQDKIIQPSVQSRDKANDELLIVANLLSARLGESLFAQWLMCTAHQNWLQKYGRVRMLCFLPEATAQKFLSGPGFTKRNRSAIKREFFSDCNLIAVTESDGDNYSPDGAGYDPNLLVKDQPVVMPLGSILPGTERAALVEVIPRKDVGVNIDVLDFVTQILMFRASQRLGDAIKYLSPGAEEYLTPKIQNIIDKIPRDLTVDEFRQILDEFEKWPFKPSVEDRMSLNPLVEDR